MWSINWTSRDVQVKKKEDRWMHNCHQNKLGREEIVSTIKWSKIFKEDKLTKYSNYLFIASCTRQMNQKLHFSWWTWYEESRKVRMQVENCHLDVP